MTPTDLTPPKLRTVSTSKTTGVVELRYVPRDVAVIDPKSTYDPETSSHGRMYQKIFGMKASMFDNIKPGDFVQTKSWLPVTGVDGDSITIDDSFTTGRESIVGHKPKERTPDEIWASWSDEQKRALIHGVQV